MAKRSQQKWKYSQKRADNYENQLILAFKCNTFHICTWQVHGGNQTPETCVNNTCCLILLHLEIQVRLGFILVQTPSGCYSDRSTHPFQHRDACDGELWWPMLCQMVVWLVTSTPHSLFPWIIIFILDQVGQPTGGALADASMSLISI